MSPSSPLGAHRMIGLALFLIAAAVYANSIGNGFALDDESIVLRNERAHGIEKVGEALTSPYWPTVPPRVGLYRPLAVASYAVEWDLWNRSPAGYHAVNVVLHAAVTVLVFAFLLRLGARALPAALGAAVFAVHPVHTEAVANVVGRAELYAAFFYLAACLLYLHRSLHPAVRLPGLAVCSLLALGAKETGVTLPVTLLLLEAAFLAESRPEGLARRVLRQAPVWLVLAGTAAAYALLRAAATGVLVGADPEPSLQLLSLGDRLATAARVWPEYVRLLLYPRDLVADYSPGVIFPVSGFEVRSLLGILVALAAFLLAAAAWPRDRLLAVGVLWFPITILPVANVFVTVGVLLAERTLYLPSVALSIVVTALAARAAALLPARRRGLAVAAAAVLLLGAGWTWRRSPVWRSSVTVLDSLIEEHPESFRAQWTLAQRLAERGRKEDALRLFARASELQPTHYGVLMDHATALIAARRSPEAEPLLRRALTLVPEHPGSYLLLSTALMNQGRHEEAIDVIASGIARSRCGSERLYHNLAFAYSELGMWHAALDARTRSLRLAGSRADAAQWLHLARVQHALGRAAEAETSLRRARSPGGPERRNGAQR